MNSKYLFPKLNLQLFAEGAGAGDGGTGAEGAQGVTAAAALPQTKGVKANPLADVKYGIQEEEGNVPAAEEQPAQTAAPNREAEFEALIKGQYKDLYDARIQDTIQKRLKGSKETVDKYNALTPTLELLARKYGVKDAGDIEALNKAINDDDTYFEEEALEKGITVEQLKEIKKMERENADLRRQMQERQTQENADKLYASWMEQAEATKQVYPSFNLEAEIKGNPKFVDLLKSNIDVRTAYEVIHKDDIISGAMQFTAQQVEKKLANKIMAGGNRPSENGMSSQGAAVIKNDVTLLTKKDRAEVHRRVAQGEKISFG